MALRLDDLDYFLAVVRHARVRRAALELGVSQPAVTQGIQRLEAALGFPLFVRSRGGMALTAVAEHFHARVAPLRHGLGDALREASDLHLGERGLLRVGVSPLYVARLFVPAGLRLHRERPAARISLHSALNDELLRALRRGDLDLALSALPAATPEDLQALPLIEDDLWLVVREGHPLLARRRLGWKDLAQAGWMLPGPAVAGRRAVEGRLAEAGLPPPRVVVEMNNSAAPLLDLVRHSDLVSLLGASSLASEAGRGLARLPIAEARFRRQVGALLRRDAAVPPLAQRFVEILQALPVAA
ncbi:LysR family transcriptional regulator [Piscinibacter sakaiensis]|uniref:HTH lysR-type domain-containing protein n=1 Tax=Piscinibacter sakaiensis TaxID=1547922 RepID=A0A0K8P0P6_PISS1|nr:LysR family transcriptional regulator [Piscinibacter sakaiensis]GAP36196.1 hypothetical protein ISF6_2036 [Piscinibacter sakaiensis]